MVEKAQSGKSHDHAVFVACLNNGIIAYLNSVTKAEIYIPNEPTNAYELSVERSVFADWHQLSICYHFSPVGIYQQ